MKPYYFPARVSKIIKGKGELCFLFRVLLPGGAEDGLTVKVSEIRSFRGFSSFRGRIIDCPFSNLPREMGENIIGFFYPETAQLHFWA